MKFFLVSLVGEVFFSSKITVSPLDFRVGLNVFSSLPSAAKFFVCFLFLFLYLVFFVFCFLLLR